MCGPSLGHPSPPFGPRLLLPRHSCELVCKASWPASAATFSTVHHRVYTGCNLLTVKRRPRWYSRHSLTARSFSRDVCAFGPVSFPESEYSGERLYGRARLLREPRDREKNSNKPRFTIRTYIEKITLFIQLPLYTTIAQKSC